MLKKLRHFFCKLSSDHMELRATSKEKGLYLYCPACGWESPGFGGWK